MSCATPSVNFDGYKPQNGKLPLKVAMIISSDLKQKTLKSSVYGNCMLSGRPDKLIKGTINANNNIGVAFEKLLTPMPRLGTTNDENIRTLTGIFI